MACQQLQPTATHRKVERQIIAKQWQSAVIKLMATCTSAMRSFGASAVLIFGAVDSKCGLPSRCYHFGLQMS